MSNTDGQTEDRLNRILRRADWRFLLPDPQPAVSICFAEGELAQAVAAISGRVKKRNSTLCADCDLAVAVNPNRQTLRAVWAALRPGGMCYTEWSTPIVGRFARARQTLQQTGFEQVIGYWSWPPPDHAPLFWQPLEASGAWRYLLTSRPPDRSRLRQLARLTLRRMSHLAYSLGLLTPVSAIARKPIANVPATSAAPPSLTDWLRLQWAEWQPGPEPEQNSVLLLTGGRRSSSKIVALAFAEPDPRPQLVVKMPRTIEAVESLKKEAAILEVVQTGRTRGLRGAPRVLLGEDRQNLFMLVETVLTGVPLFDLLARDNYREWALKATDWLIELAGTPVPAPRSQWWWRLIEPVLTGFCNSFGSVLNPARVTEMHETLAKIEALPLGCEHRDYSPWNVLVSPTGDLVVLDWESAEMDGLPGLDLIYFLVYLAFFFDGTLESRHFVGTYRSSLNPGTFIGGIQAECLTRYGRALGLDPGTWHALRLFTWMFHAQSEYARLTADAGGTPSPAALQQSMFMQLWEEEMQWGGAAQSSICITGSMDGEHDRTEYHHPDS
jgi:predicted Ser/Thr protein kinase